MNINRNSKITVILNQKRKEKIGGNRAMLEERTKKRIPCCFWTCILKRGDFEEGTGQRQVHALKREMEAAVVCETVNVSTETNYITTKSYSSWAKTSILMSKHSAKFFSPDFITSSLLKYWTGLLGWWVAELVDSLTLHTYESLITTKLPKMIASTCLTRKNFLKTQFIIPFKCIH